MPDPIVGVYPDGTLLEGDLPERSANYGPLSAFAAKTEEDWDAELRGAEDDRWGGLLAGLFDGLTDGISFVAALLEGLGSAIFGAVDWAWTTVSDFFEGLWNAFTGKWNQTNNASSTASQALALVTSSEVSGGVAVSDDFNGSSSSDLGSNYTRVSSGAGAGSFGRNGSGLAVWTISGSANRLHIDRRNTALATDYQAVYLTIATSTQKAGNSYLIGRCDSTADNLVYAAVSPVSIEIGCRVGGTWQSPFDLSYSGFTFNAGDQWVFLIGTDTDDRQFILKQNGVTKMSVTDSSDVSALGASYRYCGLGSQALGVSSTQWPAPSLTSWGGYDRAATSV